MQAQRGGATPKGTPRRKSEEWARKPKMWAQKPKKLTFAAPCLEDLSRPGRARHGRPRFKLRCRWHRCLSGTEVGKAASGITLSDPPSNLLVHPLTRLSMHIPTTAASRDADPHNEGATRRELASPPLLPMAWRRAGLPDELRAHHPEVRPWIRLEAVTDEHRDLRDVRQWRSCAHARAHTPAHKLRKNAVAPTNDAVQCCRDVWRAPMPLASKPNSEGGRPGQVCCCGGGICGCAR